MPEINGRYVINIDRVIGTDLPEFYDGPYAIADRMDQAETWLKEHGFRRIGDVWLNEITYNDRPITIIQAFIYVVQVI